LSVQPAYQTQRSIAAQAIQSAWAVVHPWAQATSATNWARAALHHLGYPVEHLAAVVGGGRAPGAVTGARCQHGIARILAAGLGCIGKEPALGVEDFISSGPTRCAGKPRR
jgi:hypothetical protein